MLKRSHPFGDWCVLFTEATCLASVFCLFGSTSSDYYLFLSLPQWIIWMSVCHIFYVILLQRPRNLGLLGAFGVPLFSIGAYMILSHSSCGTTTGALFGLLFVLISLVRTVMLRLEPYNERRALSYVELSVCAWLFCTLFQLGGITLPAACQMCLTASVILCFFALIASRLFPQGLSVVQFSRKQGVLALIACAAALVGLSFVFRWTYLPAQQGVLQASHAAAGLAADAGNMLMRALNWLFSLLPVTESGTFTPPESVGASMETEASEMTMEALPTWLLPAVLIAVLVLAVILFVALFRRTHVGGTQTETPSPAERSRLPHPLALLRDALRRLLMHLRFRWLCWRYRGTPQGILLHLERWAKAAKIPRTPGQTPRAFLQALSLHLCFADLQPQLMQLADEIDRCYFAPDRPTHPQPAPTLRKLLHIPKR